MRKRNPPRCGSIHSCERVAEPYASFRPAPPDLLNSLFTLKPSHFHNRVKSTKLPLIKSIESKAHDPL
jgi:hypothetical protein